MKIKILILLIFFKIVIADQWYHLYHNVAMINGTVRHYINNKTNEFYNTTFDMLNFLDKSFTKKLENGSEKAKKYFDTLTERFIIFLKETNSNISSTTEQLLKKLNQQVHSILNQTIESEKQTILLIINSLNENINKTLMNGDESIKKIIFFF